MVHFAASPAAVFPCGFGPKAALDGLMQPRKTTRIGKRTLLACAMALGVGFSMQPASVFAHCDLPHRHFAGRVYYIVCSRYYEPVWCDGWGTLRTRDGQAWQPKPVKEQKPELPAARCY
jgi:hypothetical protein